MILPLMNEALLKVPDLCTSLFRFLLFVSDLASDILFQVREQTILDLLRCVNLALDNEFGFERMKVALEVVTNLASQQQCHKLVDEHEDCSLSESSAITPTTTTKTNHNNFIATLLAQFVDVSFMIISNIFYKLIF
jgi:hypothetical protein